MIQSKWINYLGIQIVWTSLTSKARRSRRRSTLPTANIALEMKARQYELSYIGHNKNVVLNYSVYMKSGLVSPNASISFSVFPSLQ